MLIYFVALACLVVVCGIGYVVYDLVYSPDWGPETFENTSDEDPSSGEVK